VCVDFSIDPIIGAGYNAPKIGTVLRREDGRPEFTKAPESDMKKQQLQLANTIWWNHDMDDKVYLDNVQMVIAERPFATRQVLLRFASGLQLDLSLFDMDHLAVEYLTLRGIQLSSELRELTNAKPPPKCDFVVPNSLMARLEGPESLPESGNQKRCSRCGQNRAESGDWYVGLCPECADQAEGD
jgi:hypothetical protein